MRSLTMRELRPVMMAISMPALSRARMPGAIAGAEGLQLFAIVAHIDEAIGEHSIHIAHQQADLRRPLVLAARVTGP